jgi:tryptophanase
VLSTRWEKITKRTQNHGPAQEARERIRGLRMVYEPRYLRFFQARFEPR